MIADRIAAGEIQLVEDAQLREFIRGRRWYGSKTQEIAHAHVVDAALVRSEAPLLVVAVAEVRFHEGTHDLYQLLFGLRPGDDDPVGETIGEIDGWRVYDALADPALARELLSLMRRGAAADAVEGTVDVRGDRPGRARRRARDAAGGRRAVEHVRRLRRRADPEGVPPARGRDQPGARAPALPHAQRVRQHRRPARLVRVLGAAGRGDARDPAAVRAGRRGRVGARPRRAAVGARGVPDPSAPAGRGHRRDALGARLRPVRPRLRAGGPERRGHRAPDRDGRRGDRADLPRPPRDRRRRPRSSAAARRCATGCG